MNILSSALIALLEKELQTVAPEAEQFILNLLGNVASDLMNYVEKKIGISQPSSQPASSSTTQ